MEMKALSELQEMIERTVIRAVHLKGCVLRRYRLEFGCQIEAVSAILMKGHVGITLRRFT